MPRVATYYQLLDNPVDVSATPLTLNQSVADTPAGGEGALVTWFAGAAVAGSGVVTYTVTLNGSPIGSYEVISTFPTITGASRIPVQETIASSVVKHGSGAAGNNVLVFTKTGGLATLTLSAVMLWHRVNV